MSARCPNCDRPVATDDDFKSIPEGEGKHLCWAPWNMGVCDVSPEDVIARLRRENRALWYVVGLAKSFVDLWNKEEDRPMLPMYLDYAGSKLGAALDSIHGKDYECPVDYCEEHPCVGCMASLETDNK